MKDPLLIHFAANHPADFARAVAGHSSQEVLDLIMALEPGLAAPVVAHLDSLKLHDTLSRLPDVVLGKLLVACDQSSLIALLSHLPDERYSSIIGAAPADQKSALQRILDLSLTTVGSLAGPDLILLNGAASCVEVITLLQENSHSATQTLIVVDAGSRYLGLLRPLVLLPAANARRRVEELAERVEPLLARMPIRSALESKQWRYFAALPVVDHAFQVLGVVANHQLHAAALTHHRETPGLDEVLEQAALGYLEVCTDLLDIGIGRRNG